MDEESLATDAERSMFKELSIKQLSRNHPDILHVTKKEKKDPSIEEIDLKIKKLEEIFDKNQRGEDLSCEDELEFSSDDDSDDEIYIPTQRHWFKQCTEIWGTMGNGDGDDIKARVKVAPKGIFEIYTEGVFSNDGSSGYGAVLRDCFHRPIAAWSRDIPKTDHVSTFYHKLQGVFLGVQMAKKYQVSLVHFYCSSKAVIDFVLNFHRRKALCFCSASEPESHCQKCYMLMMKTKNKEEYGKGYELMSSISSDVSALKRQGLAYFHVSDVEGERNEAARWMAQLGEDKDMDLTQISESDSLSEILYKDVFRILLEE